MKIALLFITLFSLSFAHAITPCEAALDPRVDWQAINEPGKLPEMPVGRLSAVDIRTTARQGGVWMKDDANHYWMVKPDNYFPELTASTEVISSLIYSHFGLYTPKTVKVWIDGKAYAAVRSVGRGLDNSLLLYMYEPKWRAMRMPAAFLKDWDRIHEGPNNFIIGPKDFIPYDFGGTLGARATGKHKPGPVFSDAVGSYTAQTFKEMYDGFRLTDPTDPNRLNPNTPPIPLPDWHPWAQVTREDQKLALKGFESLTDANIRQYVHFAAYSQPSDEDYMIRTLISNRDAFILGLQNEINPFPIPAAGAIIYKFEEGRLKILLRKVAGDYGGYVWSFAKGRLNGDESLMAAAKREVFEEMGVHVQLGDLLTVARGDTTLTYFYLASVEGEIDLSFSGEETEKIEWFDIDRAFAVLNKHRDLIVLKSLIEKLNWSESSLTNK